METTKTQLGFHLPYYAELFLGAGTGAVLGFFTTGPAGGVGGSVVGAKYIADRWSDAEQKASTINTNNDTIQTNKMMRELNEKIHIATFKMIGCIVASLSSLLAFSSFDTSEKIICSIDSDEFKCKKYLYMKITMLGLFSLLSYKSYQIFSDKSYYSKKKEKVCPSKI